MKPELMETLEKIAIEPIKQVAGGELQEMRRVITDLDKSLSSCNYELMSLTLRELSLLEHDIRDKVDVRCNRTIWRASCLN